MFPSSNSCTFSHRVSVSLPYLFEVHSSLGSTLEGTLVLAFTMINLPLTYVDSLDSLEFSSPFPLSGYPSQLCCRVMVRALKCPEKDIAPMFMIYLLTVFWKVQVAINSMPTFRKDLP